MSTSTLIEFAAHYDLDPAAPETLADYREYCEKLTLLEAAMAEAFEEVQTEPLVSLGNSRVAVAIAPAAMEPSPVVYFEGLPPGLNVGKLVQLTPKQQRAISISTALHFLDRALNTPDTDEADDLREQAWELLDQAVASYRAATLPTLQQGASA